MTGAEALREGAARLRGAGVEDPAGDARRLLAHALGVAPERLTLCLRDAVQDVELGAFLASVDRRAARVPVAQIVGARLFWGREFRVTADVLDPRPETETVVAAALEAPFARVLDLGTGSGCLLVTLLAERPGATGVGVDLSAAALAVADANARRHGVAERAELREGDWWAGAGGVFDLVVSNPPYIARAEMAGLAPEVRDHEPSMALSDGGDGLGAYRAILGAGPRRVAPGGRLVVEHGTGQEAAVAAIGMAAGWPAPEARRDLDGRARVAVFRAP